MNGLAPALLENWLRDYYFTTEIDISSSGVENFSLAELREFINLTQGDIDHVIFQDSRSCGDPLLRKAMAERWGNGNLEQVMATTGSSEAIFLVMHALAQPGDEIVVLEPCYHSLVHIAESIGCRLKRWSLRSDLQFVPDVEEAKRLIGPDTRMVVVNFPHNPTGASLTAEQQADLIYTVSKNGCYLVWDAAFAQLTYNSPPLPDATLLYDRAISIGTLSKAYGLPGLRVGWCLAPPDVLSRCVHIRDYTTLYLSPLIELIALRAVENADRILSFRLKQARANLEILAEWAYQHRDFVEWVAPCGGVTAFIGLSDIDDAETFCHRFKNTYGVLLVPGTCFNHPSHVRLGFGGPTAQLREGLSRLSRMLNEYKYNQTSGG